MPTPNPLRALLEHPPAAFALLFRPDAGPDEVDIVVGAAEVVPLLADVPVPALRTGLRRQDLLVLLPYRQLRERGFACHDDATPLIAMRIHDQSRIPLTDALRELPDDPAELTDGRFDVDDEAYGVITRRVLDEAIGRGKGSNFVIRRTYQAVIENYSARTGLAIFRRLLLRERGAQWTFIVHCGGRTLVGATPERHVSLDAGRVTMNPISGTYRYPADGADLDDVLRFLADGKESDELSMVVDEELKMMGQVCDGGVRLVGPALREMAYLAHTEYLIEGHTALDFRELLTGTMFAPTVTGSPLGSACDVITTFEPDGRGYYGGVLALVGQRDGQRTLDSAILIRTADIGPNGQLTIGSGSTLVRHGDPAGEAAETRAKVAGLLAALTGTATDTTVGGGGSVAPQWAAEPAVRRALATRNAALARFWLDGSAPGNRPVRAGAPSVLIVDADDAFTTMLAIQVRSLGAAVTIQRYESVRLAPEHDVVIIGPGPGDPTDHTDPKIVALRDLTTRLLRHRIPTVAVCLGHQVLASLLGVGIRRRPRPSQGEQRKIDLFGRTERVGCYNTFAAYCGVDRIFSDLVVGPVLVSRDQETGEVNGLRAAGVRSIQFHAESVLTEHGPAILNGLLTGVLDSTAASS